MIRAASNAHSSTSFLDQFALNPITFVTVSVPDLGDGNGPCAQMPRVEPPLITTDGISEPPTGSETAAFPKPGAGPKSTFVNLYPGPFAAGTMIPYCTVSRSMSLPVPYPHRGFWDVSSESRRSMPA